MTLKIRPVKLSDHAEILKLAREAGIGMSSLPQDGDVLHEKIAHAARSFAGKPEHPKEERFLFVLEDMEKKRLAGTTGIVAHVGLKRPFYSYKLSTITQASAGVNIYSLQQVLHMVNDYTDATEIGSLFLHPDYRRDGIGKMLSRCRYLMMAEFPDLFSPVVISEFAVCRMKKAIPSFMITSHAISLRWNSSRRTIFMRRRERNSLPI